MSQFVVLGACYNDRMKVWRCFTLVLWAVVMSVCLTVILYNHAVQNSILDSAESKQRIANSKAYDTLRDTVLVNQVMRSIEERYPADKLIDRPLLSATLADILPSKELQTRIEPVIDTTYQWLDSKKTEVEFSVSVADKREPFYRALESRLSKKIATLPACEANVYPPEDALFEDLCRPEYVTAGEATQAVMGAIRANQFPLSEVTQDSFVLDAQLAGIKKLPSYVSYLWAANLLAIAVMLFATILVLWSRRSLGVMALGASMLIAGLVALLVQSSVAGASIGQGGGEYTPVIAALKDALMPRLSDAVTKRAVLAMLAGVVLAMAGGVWRWRQTKAAG